MDIFVELIDDIEPNYRGKNNNAYKTLFEQYEKVIVESLITSFGLDFLVKDQYGGGVDTIHNVRAMDHDSNLYYKDAANRCAYENRGAYNTQEYHSHSNYKKTNEKVSLLKKAGNAVDAYTGEKICSRARTDLDHIVSAKEIHDDRARVLSGLKGSDLANCNDNLAVTNPHTNRSKKALEMKEFLEKKGHEYTEEQRERMRSLDKKARSSIDRQINVAYYTSPKFFRSISLEAGQVGFAMGTRQVLGLIFSEIWFSIRAEIKNACGSTKRLLKSIGKGFTKGLENAKKRYKYLWKKFVEGALAGAMSSLTTTLLNTFVTTAKNFIHILRECWTNLVEAVKIVCFNPDCLPTGERFKAAAKVLATGASVVVGTIAAEAVSSTGIATIPVVGEVVSSFVGALITGIMSCTLLYTLDHCVVIENLVQRLNDIPNCVNTAAHYRHLAYLLDQYAKNVMEYDTARFKEDTLSIRLAVSDLDEEDVKDQHRFRTKIRRAQKRLNINPGYDTKKHRTFDDHMKDKKSKCTF